MAIARDDFTSTYNTYTNVSTWSHTCSGENRFLIVGIVLLGDSPPAHDVVSCTYNDVSLTKLTDADNSGVHIELWYMVAPPQGTYDVEVTHDGTFTTSWSLGMAASYIGVKQTSPIDVYDESVSVLSAIGVSLTTTDNREAAIAIGGKYEGSDILVLNAGQSGNVVTTGAGWGLVGAISDKTITSPGLSTVGYTYTDGSDGAIIALALKEESTAPNTPITSWIKDSGVVIDTEVSYLTDELGNYLVDETGAYLQDSISTDGNQSPHDWNDTEENTTMWANATEDQAQTSTRTTAQDDTRTTVQGDTRISITGESTVKKPTGWTTDEY